MSEGKRKSEFGSELRQLQSQYAAAQSPLEIKNVKAALHVLKTKIRNTNDTKALRDMLTWERSRRLLQGSDEYELNRMEMEDLKDECECFQKIGASGIPAELGGRYKYTSHFDDGRQCEVYITYIPKVVEPEEQIGPQLAWKINQGFMPEMGDYPPPKELVRRVSLRASEWLKYFRPVEA